MVITARSLGRGRVTVLTLNLFQFLLFQYVFLAGRELSKLAIRRVHICLSVRIRVADPIDRISRRTALRLRPTAVLDELLAGGRPFQGFWILFPKTESRVPRPRVFCEGGNDAADTIQELSHVSPATLSRRRTPALYHVLLLPSNASSLQREKARPVPDNSGS